MSSVTDSDHTQPNLPLTNSVLASSGAVRAAHAKRISEDLRRLGVTRYGLHRLASRYLPNVIHLDEQLGGVVYGRQEIGSVMLVATDRRVIFIDKKPLFINEDEIRYGVVSGVSFSHAGFGTTVTLHTRIRDYRIHTFNQKCAMRFVEYIEARCLENKNERKEQ